jgi:hypothetical protein
MKINTKREILGLESIHSTQFKHKQYDDNLLNLFPPNHPLAISVPMGLALYLL